MQTFLNMLQVEWEKYQDMRFSNPVKPNTTYSWCHYFKFLTLLNSSTESKLQWHQPSEDIHYNQYGTIRIIVLTFIKC